MNSWFYDTFLSSLFERCKPNADKWLTAKQTAVCVRYMEKQVVRFDSDGYGTMCNHDNYICEWQGRKVFLWYSKKNGCGAIRFGYDAEELAVHRMAYEEERKVIETQRLERLKRNPERLAKRIANIELKIQGWMEEYSLDSEEGDEEAMRQDLEAIQALRKELETLI